MQSRPLFRSTIGRGIYIEHFYSESYTHKSAQCLYLGQIYYAPKSLLFVLFRQIRGCPGWSRAGVPEEVIWELWGGSDMDLFRSKSGRGIYIEHFYSC